LLIPGVHDTPDAVRLYDRHFNHAERWVSVEMQSGHEGYRAAFPGDGTNSVYSLQYYSELQRGTDAVWLYPVFIPGTKRMAHFDD
jgi:hypothetical protein